MRSVSLIASTLTLLATAPVLAEDQTASMKAIGLSGSLRGGFWTSSRTLDDREDLATAALWLKAAPKLLTNVSLFAEGWVMNSELFHGDETEGELREVYLDLSLGPVDLRVGKQIIMWGRADRFNPTDNLTPRDFTLLVPEDNDQRSGTAAVKVAYYHEDLSLTAIWLPHFEPDTIPIQSVPPPLTINERTPDESFEQWAIKVERSGGALEGSLSYFNGFDLFPDIGITSPTGLLLEHHRIRVVGADIATTWGRYGLRGETAYTFTKDSEGTDPSVKNPFFFLVLGGDRTFLEYLNVNLQYLLRIVTRYQDPEAIPDSLQQAVAIQQSVVNNQRDRIQQGASLRVSHKWLNETLEGEVAGIYFSPHPNYAIRPKVTYAFTDRWKGLVGADLFRGPDDSFFGYLRYNSAVYAELRYSF